MRIPRKISKTAGRATVEQLTTPSPQTAIAPTMAAVGAITKSADAIGRFHESMLEAEDVAEAADQDREYQRRRNELLADKRFDLEETDGRPTAEIQSEELTKLQEEFRGSSDLIRGRDRRVRFQNEIDSRFLSEQAALAADARKQRIGIARGKIDKSAAEDFSAGTVAGHEAGLEKYKAANESGLIGDSNYAALRERRMGELEKLQHIEKVRGIAEPARLAASLGNELETEKLLRGIMQDDSYTPEERDDAQTLVRGALATNAAASREQDLINSEANQGSYLDAVTLATENNTFIPVDELKRKGAFGEDTDLYLRAEEYNIRQEAKHEESLRAEVDARTREDIAAGGLNGYFPSEEKIRERRNDGYFGDPDSSESIRMEASLLHDRAVAVKDYLEFQPLMSALRRGQPLPSNMTKNQKDKLDLMYEQSSPEMQLNIISNGKYVPKTQAGKFGGAVHSAPALANEYPRWKEIREAAPEARMNITDEQASAYEAVDLFSQSMSVQDAAELEIEMRHAATDEQKRINRDKANSAAFKEQMPDWADVASDTFADADIDGFDEIDVTQDLQRYYLMNFEVYGDPQIAQNFATKQVQEKYSVNDLNGGDRVMAGGPSGDFGDRYRTQIRKEMEQSSVTAYYFDTESGENMRSADVDIDEIVIRPPIPGTAKHPLLYKGGSAVFVTKDGRIVEPTFEYDDTQDQNAVALAQRDAAIQRVDETRRELAQAEAILRSERGPLRGEKQKHVEDLRRQLTKREERLEGTPTVSESIRQR